MDDTITCPICGNKLKNSHLVGRYLPTLDKTSNFIERTCVKGYNHSLIFYVDSVTNKVDWVKLSLPPQNTRWVEINYATQKCRIVCVKDGKSSYIDIDKTLEPDFPNLIKLKEKVGIYVIFS